DVTHDLAHGQLVGRPRQAVSALGTTPALHEPAPLELAEDHLQEADRDHLTLGDLGNLERVRSGVLGQGIDRADRIVTLRRYTHSDAFPLELTQSSLFRQERSR